MYEDVTILQMGRNRPISGKLIVVFNLKALLILLTISCWKLLSIL